MDEKFDLFSLPTALLRSLIDNSLNLCDVARLLAATVSGNHYDNVVEAVSGCVVAEMSMFEDYDQLLLNWCIKHNIGARKWDIANISHRNMPQIRHYIAQFGGSVETIRFENAPHIVDSTTLFLAIQEHCLQLKRLCLCNCFIDQQLVELLNALKFVEEVQFHHARVKTQLPVENKAWSRVTRLVFHDVQDIAVCNVLLASCPAVQSIVFVGCKNAAITNALHQCTSVKFWDCGPLCPVLLSHMMQLVPGLRKLDMRFCNIDRRHTEVLKKHGIALVELGLDGNEHVANISVKHICDAFGHSLKSLSLGGKWSMGHSVTSRDVLLCLRKCTELQHLRINCVYLTRNSLKCIAQVTIGSLDLRGCMCSDTDKPLLVALQSPSPSYNSGFAPNFTREELTELFDMGSCLY